MRVANGYFRAGCSLFRKESMDDAVYRPNALDHATPKEAVGKALNSFKERLDGPTSHALGFDSLAEGKTANLGNRSLVFLGRIKAKDTTGMEGDWRPAQFGGSNLIQNLDPALVSLQQDRKIGFGAAFLVLPEFAHLREFRDRTQG